MPQGLCQAYKDFAGNPVDVQVQQDAIEYLLGVLDKLENKLKDTKYTNLLQVRLHHSFLWESLVLTAHQDTLRGERTAVMVCSNCGNTKRKPEPFYTLALEVRGITVSRVLFIYVSMLHYVLAVVLDHGKSFGSHGGFRNHQRLQVRGLRRDCRIEKALID